MQQIYSPFKNVNVKPNHVFNILDRVQPDLDKIDSYFENSEYQKVIDVYENLTKQYNSFETDLSKIAFSYYQLGRYDEAKEFILNNSSKNNLQDLLILAEIFSIQGLTNEVISVCNDAINNFDSPEAAIILASIYNENGDENNEVHAYYTILKQVNPVLRFKAFSELARLNKNDTELSEYYLYMCFSFIQSNEDIDTFEFMNAFNLLSGELNSLLSNRIKTLIHSQNHKFGRLIENLYYVEYNKIFEKNTVKIDIAEYSKDIIETGVNLIDRIKQHIQLKGDFVIRSITEQLIEEKPTFAFSYSD